MCLEMFLLYSRDYVYSRVVSRSCKTNKDIKRQGGVWTGASGLKKLVVNVLIEFDFMMD